MAVVAGVDFGILSVRVSRALAPPRVPFGVM